MKLVIRPLRVPVAKLAHLRSIGAGYCNVCNEMTIGSGIDDQATDQICPRCGYPCAMGIGAAIDRKDVVAYAPCED